MKRLFLLVYICILAFVAQAQTKYELRDNDIVTISYENGGTRTYLAVNDRGAIAAYTAANDNCLWQIVRCSYGKHDWGDQNVYYFQHYKTKQYLHVNATKDNRGRYDVRFVLGNNASEIHQNNPNNVNSNDQGKYEHGRFHYYFDNTDFIIQLENGNWVLKQGNNAPTLQVEKWEQKQNIGFASYFSPGKYYFQLVKEYKLNEDGTPQEDESNNPILVGNEEDVQQKEVRFVLDLRDSTYLSCVRRPAEKTLDNQVVTEDDLSILSSMYNIQPTFTWKSNGGTESQLNLNAYTSTVETANRKMLSLEGGKISTDNLAWVLALRTYGKSPMALKTKHNTGVETWADFVDTLVVSWSYNNQNYTNYMPVVRKSYHTEALPEFDFLVSPSTFTFPGINSPETKENELEQTFTITGIHQHGTAYYDVDNYLVERFYTYGPKEIPSLTGGEINGYNLEVKFAITELNKDAQDNPIYLDENVLDGTDKCWLSVKENTLTNKSLTLVAQENTDAFRRARLYGTFTLYKQDADGNRIHEHGGVIEPIINQRRSGGAAIEFLHSGGISHAGQFDALKDCQQVHIAERVIYYTPNQEIELRLAESNFFGYMRWYDYASNGQGGDPRWNPTYPTSWRSTPTGANGVAFSAINTDSGNSHGLYGINDNQLTSASADNPAPILYGWNYTYPTESTIATQQDSANMGYHTIACDVSAYTDYNINRDNNNSNKITSITEPTLSYRQLFRLKPAEEIARKLNENSHLNEPKFLENYKYMATTGTGVHLATQFRYAKYSHESELCYFFHDKENKLKRVGKDAKVQWRKIVDGVTTIIDKPDYQIKDYLYIGSAAPGTVVYELVVPQQSETGKGNAQLLHELKIARFEVVYKSLEEQCGPSAQTLITEQRMTTDYKLLKKIDFNYTGNVYMYDKTNGCNQLDCHLPWDQSTYGYYYPKGENFASLGETSPNRKDQSIPYYGEYFLINKIHKDWAQATAHGGVDDYALYVDGTTEPGVVASITTNQVICEGQTLYCSAWFCNPSPKGFNGSANPADPIFRCNVQGRKKDGAGKWNDWEDISVFFVGRLEQASGWQQIVFPVESEKSYEETRVSIYNFAGGGSGNDFMVDDICLFASRLPLASYQAQTNCASEANTESSTAVILRIDYTEFEGDKEKYMYYQIFKEKNTLVDDDRAFSLELKKTLQDNGNDVSAYFHENNAYKDAMDFGSVLIPTKDYTPSAEKGDAIYTTVQDFKNALVDQIQSAKTNAGTSDYEKSAHAKAYIEVTDIHNHKKWVLYVMHIIPNAEKREGEVSNLDENKYLFEYNNYTLRMANVPDELAAPECNMQTPLHATQDTRFYLINGDGDLIGGYKAGSDDQLKVGFIPESPNNCANDYYTLHSMIENVMAIRTGADLDIVQGDVLADWLVGYEFDDIYTDTKNHDVEKINQAKVEFQNKYGYSRAAIKTAILYDMRRPYDNPNLNATRFEDLKKEAFLDPANYEIIKHLCDSGWLQLRTSKTSFYLSSEDVVRYWVYPIDGTATAEYAGQKVTLHDCSEPVWVKVSAAKSEHVLNIAPINNANKTTLQKMQIPTVRVLQRDLEDKRISVKVSDIGLNTGVNGGATLIDNSESIEFNFADIEFIDPNSKEILTIKPTTFNVGDVYTVRVRMTDGTNEYVGGNSENCRVGTLYFNLLVLPNRVIWAPSTGIYDGWGLDENWLGWNDKNNNGQIDDDELTAGYVPVAGSEVIIGNVPMDESIEFPTIDAYEHYPFVHDHNHYPMDVNASPFTCGKIYFAPGAHIHNQYLLIYEEAYVDMTIPTGSWYMMSAPLQKMYSSDMYIPHTGWWNNGENKESSDPFVVNPFEKSGQYQSIRHEDAAYAFWQAFYNQSVNSYAESPDGLRVINEKVDAQFIPSNTLAQPLQVGSGYNVYGLGIGEEQLVVRLPKPDIEYYYYSPSGDKTNQSVSVSRKEGDVDLSHKLAFPASVGDTEMSITLKNEKASEYFLFGNPTMAYIDMSKFAQDNQAITSTFYTVQNNSWETMTPFTATHLAPMTSVLLETKDKAPQPEIMVVLKAEHLVHNNHLHSEDDHEEEQPAFIAPRLAPNENSQSSSEVMTIYAYASGARARTVLATTPIANDYYQIGEDALFISTGVENQSAVTTPLNMYTVAEQVPMMADVRQGISEIPLGMLVADGYRTTHMQVAFHLSANWTRSCYFCDSKTGQKICIMDGLVISVEMPQNHEQRYYIEGPDEYIGSNGGGVTTSTTQPSESGNAKVWAYSQESNSLTIGSSDIIQEVKVYDMAGRMIAHKLLDLFHSSVTLQAPAGVCLIEAVLRDDTILRTQTIVK